MGNNDLEDLNNIISIYRSRIDTNLDDQLENYVASTLSNMLAIHYFQFGKDPKFHNEQSAECIEKIREHLGEKIVVESDFGVVLELFTVAISQEEQIRDSKSSEANKSVEDIIALQLIDFADVVPLRSFSKELNKLEDKRQLFNYLLSNKKDAKKIFEKYPTKDEQSASANFGNIFSELRTAYSDKNQTTIVKDAVESFAIIAAGSALTLTSIGSLGILASAAIIPATIVGYRAIASSVCFAAELTMSNISELARTKLKFAPNIHANQARTQESEKTPQIDIETSKEAKNLLSEITKNAAQVAAIEKTQGQKGQEQAHGKKQRSSQ